MKAKDYIITSSGIKMPKIIYGTAWKKERTTTLVEAALRCGFRGIDTACQPKHYSETLVGEALLNMQHEGIKREDVFIQTKFTPVSGQDLKNIPYDQNASLPKQVLQSVATSKQNLYTNYIDSLVLHSPYTLFDDLMEVWHTMESFVHKGEVGQLGISNCYSLEVLEYLYDHSKIKPAIVQNRFHAKTDYDKEIRQWCEARHIIYQSFWSLTGNPEIFLEEILDNISQKHQKSSAEIWFAFLRELNIVPLTGTSSSKHMIEDLASLDICLSIDEVKQIGTLIGDNT